MNNKNGYEYIWAISNFSDNSFNNSNFNKKTFKLKNNERRKNIVFSLNESVSPYLEINSEFINKNNFYEIEVNPYIRFNHIFNDFLYCFKKVESENSIKETIFENFKKYIENNALNYLQKLDFFTGTTIVDFYCEMILKDFENKIYGEETFNIYKKLSINSKKELAIIIYNNIITNCENIKSFKKGIKRFFPDSIIYKKKNEKNKMIIYVNYDKNIENKAKIDILKKLFLPLELGIKCYWKNHFGVIGVDKTSKIGEMSVF